jgi:hypothetical protein
MNKRSLRALPVYFSHREPRTGRALLISGLGEKEKVVITTTNLHC